jgi:tetratricopeptide (TPR) repeat protein
MVLRDRRQGRCYIKWSDKMSYINEALKKAQKEKDVQHIRLIKTLEASGEKKRKIKYKTFYYLLFSLFLILLVFIGYSWLDHFPKKESKTVSKNVSIANIPDEISDRELIYKKAGDFFKSGRTEDAEIYYKKVLELDPGYVEALNNLGVIYIHKGDYESAVSSLKKAIRLRPGYVESYYNMACLYSIKSEAEKGIIYLEKAVDLNGDVKKWALIDSDLKNIRLLPEFKEILKR